MLLDCVADKAMQMAKCAECEHMHVLQQIMLTMSLALSQFFIIWKLESSYIIF